MPERTGNVEEKRQAGDVRLSGLHAYQWEEQSGALHGAAHDDPQAHESEAATDQAAASHAHARSSAPNREVAPVDRTRPLQLLRGTRKPQEPRSVPGSGVGGVVAHSFAAENPETPDLMEAHSRVGSALASSAENTPSVSRCPLRRHSSKIRTGCANERSSGSVRGVSREWYPYRDRQVS